MPTQTMRAHTRRDTFILVPEQFLIVKDSVMFCIAFFSYQGLEMLHSWAVMSYATPHISVPI